MALKMLGLFIWTVLLCLSVGSMYVNRDVKLPVIVQWSIAAVFALSLVMIEVFSW